MFAKMRVKSGCLRSQIVVVLWLTLQICWHYDELWLPYFDYSIEFEPVHQAVFAIEFAH